MAESYSNEIFLDPKGKDKENIEQENAFAAFYKDFLREPWPLLPPRVAGHEDFDAVVMDSLAGTFEFRDQQGHGHLSVASSEATRCSSLSRCFQMLVLVRDNSEW